MTVKQRWMRINGKVHLFTFVISNDGYKVEVYKDGVQI